MKRRLGLSIAIAAVLVAASGEALAATPFTAGTGGRIALTVGSDGVGHLVWRIDGTPDRVGYCRIVVNHCEPAAQALTYPGVGPANANGQASVFAPGGGAVAIFAGCYTCGAGGAQNREARWLSADKGATFAAGSEIGEFTMGLPGPSGFGALLPGNAIAVTAGPTVFGLPVGSVAGPARFSPFPVIYDLSVTPIPGGGLLAMSSDLADLKYGTYAGPLTSDGVNTQANWTPDRAVDGAEEAASNASVTSGTGGLFVAYKSQSAAGTRVAVRKLAANGTFGLAAYTGATSSVDSGLDLPWIAEDGAGRLHLLFRSLFDGQRLRYAVSSDGGATFGSHATVAAHEDFRDPLIAVGSDGKGFAAWTTGAGAVRAVPIDPQAEPASSSGGTGGGVTLPVYDGPRRDVTVADSHGSYLLKLPRSCVKVGQRFKVTLSWKRKKRKGNLFVKVKRADFYVAGKRVKIDKTAPFRQTLTVDTGATRGAKIEVRARAFIKVRHGATPKKSIRANIRVCA